MILITVGTEKFPFNRLMTWLEQLISKGILNPQLEEIVVQYGSCTIFPSGVKGFQVVPSSQFQALVKKARLIIAHCGEGTIDLLCQIQKPFLLVPRQQQWDEHVDDHQLELANALQAQGVNIANSLEQLEAFLLAPVYTPIQFSPRNYYLATCMMLDNLFNNASQLTLNKQYIYTKQIVSLYLNQSLTTKILNCQSQNVIKSFNRSCLV